VARNVHRLGEAFRRTIEYPALQVVLGGEGDGVDQDVEPAPLASDFLEQRFELTRLLTSSGMKIGASSACASGSTYCFAFSLR
jgi:hypothetical protein